MNLLVVYFVLNVLLIAFFLLRRNWKELRIFELNSERFKAKTPFGKSYTQRAYRLVGGELEFQVRGHEFKTWHNQFLFFCEDRIWWPPPYLMLDNGC